MSTGIAALLAATRDSPDSGLMLATVTAYSYPATSATALIDGATTGVTVLLAVDQPPKVNDRVLLAGVSKRLYIAANITGSARPAQLFTGGESGIAGTAPSAGTPIIIKSGTVVVTTTGTSGGVDFDYPAAFPNGVVSIVAVPGDDTAAFTALRVLVGFCTLLHVAGHAVNNSGGYVGVGSGIRINYIATGW